MNLSFVVDLAKPNSLDMLVLVGEVRGQAGLHTIHILLHEASCCTCGLQSWPTCSTPGERPPHDVSIGMRLVGAGSELLVRAAPADELGCCHTTPARTQTPTQPQPYK